LKKYLTATKLTEYTKNWSSCFKNWL